MASRSLGDLANVVQARAVAFIDECKACGLDVLIYCTLRSSEEQNRLYACGRTAPGRIVTNARGGASAHNPDSSGKAWAFDAVPLFCGKPQWDDADLLYKMGHCGEAVGLEWAGRWGGKLRENVHFQNARDLISPGNLLPTNVEKTSEN